MGALSQMDKEGLLEDLLIEVRQLRSEKETLKEMLENEMDTNEALNDKNIALKGQIREMQHQAKVRAHPSTMRHLQSLIDQKNVAIEELKNGIELALRLIPEDRVRRMHIPGLEALVRAY